MLLVFVVVVVVVVFLLLIYFPSSLSLASQKKRKSPHALIRDDPLAHVEATTRFVIPQNSSVATKLDFTTSSSKVGCLSRFLKNDCHFGPCK